MRIPSLFVTEWLTILILNACLGLSNLNFCSAIFS